MFEYHGWATLSYDPYNSQGPGYTALVKELKEKLNEFNEGSGVFQIDAINGKHFVTFHGCRNHRHEVIFGLFEWIAQHLTGSYGLLYVWDDESNQDNEFVVYVLARGKVELRTDPFLSPCVPVIEDPFDPNRPEYFEN
jgi:hypothetical protein